VIPIIALVAMITAAGLWYRRTTATAAWREAASASRAAFREQLARQPLARLAVRANEELVNNGWGPPLAPADEAALLRAIDAVDADIERREPAWRRVLGTPSAARLAFDGVGGLGDVAGALGWRVGGGARPAPGDVWAAPRSRD
jgi:hypothetical protein